MDQVLKARKLGSATARRHKIEERQRQQRLAYEHRQQRRLKLMADTSDSESADESDSQEVSLTDHDSSTETPSECSVRTPGGPPLPEIEHFGFLQLVDPEDRHPPEEQPEVATSSPDFKSRRPDSFVPKMLASLTTTTDIAYDRYSIILGTTSTEDDDDDDFSASDEEEYICTPIEVAKHVSYSLPRARPSVICISSHSPYSALKKVDVPKRRASQDIKSPRRVSIRIASDDVPQGFLASEARPFELPDEIKTRASSVEPLSTPVTQAVPNIALPKRKSSMALLISGPKSGHSRMSSIKNLLRSSTHGSSSSVYTLGGIKEERSAIQSTDVFLEPRRSVTLPSPFPRVEEEPRPSSTRTMKEFTEERATSLYPPTSFPARFAPALPPRSPSAASDVSASSVSTTSSEHGQMSNASQSSSMRRKSFSRLRQRSGSIGQALKITTSRRIPEALEVPPVPTINISGGDGKGSNSALDLSSFPTPPLTPKSPRRSMATYSPFPSTSHRTSTIDPRLSTFGFGMRNSVPV